MCKANDIYISVLVGDERPEERQDDDDEPVHNSVEVTNNGGGEVVVGNDEDIIGDDDDNEQCDVVTSIILLVGFLMLLFVATMPCSCALVESTTTKSNSLLRGAGDSLSHMFDIVGTKNDNKQQDDTTLPFVDPLFQPTTLWFGRKKQEQDNDKEEFDVVPHHQEDTTQRKHSAYLRSEQQDQHIFSSTNLNHFFISTSGSSGDDGNEENVDLLESKSESSDNRDNADDNDINNKYSSFESPDPSTNDEDNVGSPKSYSISFDEVVISDASDGGANTENEQVLAPALSRRKILEEMNGISENEQVLSPTMSRRKIQEMNAHHAA